MTKDSESIKNTKRIGWVDIAKGVGILLVITGHSLSVDNLGIIYSFHLPLFFILSCYTHTYSSCFRESFSKTKKMFFRLVIPAWIVYLINTLLFFVFDWSGYIAINGIRSFILERVLSLLFFNPGDVNIIVCGIKVNGTGVLWFLPALFIGRTIFEFLQVCLGGIRLLAATVLLSMIGFLIGQYFVLPYSIDTALVIQPFCFVGLMMKNRVKQNNNNIWIMFSSFVVWGASYMCSCSLTEEKFIMSARHYAVYPLCIVAAISGAIVIAEVSVFLSRIKIINSILCTIGSKSMTVYIIHAIEESALFWFWLPNDVLNIFARISCIMICFYFVCLIEKRLCHRDSFTPD